MEPRVDMNLGITGEPDRWVHSACVLCSNGCGLELSVKDGKIEEHPFVLSTGRVVYQFHTRTKTGRSRALNDRAPHAYVEVNPEDAARLGIATGDLVEVTSPRGMWGRTRAIG